MNIALAKMLLPLTLFFLATQALGVLSLSKPTAPSTYILDGARLLETRQLIRQKDVRVTNGVAELRRRADQCMAEKLWSVTDKPFPPPSGDKRDYLSIAPYFWPDPDSPTGLPYILNDGKYNPEAKEYDRTRLDGMCNLVGTLALACYLTGENIYGQRAVQQLRVWFLDENTSMKPHLRYAQFVKGRDEGNPWGLLETYEMTKVIDGIALLQAVGIWPEKDNLQVQGWFAEYLEWLQTSELGIKEGNAPNNHGCVYDAQTAVFALYTGQADLAKIILEKVKERRIATQIEPDGSMPNELQRTISCHYNQLNLEMLFHLAGLAELVGVDLFNYQTTDGRSIRRALDWMVPYATGKPWPYQQIKPANFKKMVWILRQAVISYGDPSYEKSITELQNVDAELIWVNLLYPRTLIQSRSNSSIQFPSADDAIPPQSE